jgi:hypothetical protein
MNTVRPYINGGHQLPITATSVMTDENQHEVRCGICARELYVDEYAYQVYSMALISGLDNPIRCEICSEEYDDLPYEG